MIRVLDKYVVDANSHCFTLFKLGEDGVALEGKTQEELESQSNLFKEKDGTFLPMSVVGYYGTMSQCLQGILNNEGKLFTNKADKLTIDKYIEFITDLNDQLLKACEKEKLL